MIHPTPRAAWLLAAGIPLALLPVWAGGSLFPLWLAGFALALGLLVLDGLLLFPARRITAAVRTPDAIGVGDERRATVALRADPGRRGAVRVEVVAELSETLRPHAPREVRLTAEGGRQLGVPLVAARRGPASFDALWLRLAGPLGLARRTLRRPVGRPIDVVPDLSPVHQAAIRFFGSRDAPSGWKIERYRGDGSEFDSLREFVPGIDPRTLDWKASARHRRLLYRETRAERNHLLVMAIDTGNRMAETADTLPRLDHAIHTALTLGWVALRTGDRVGLFAFDARPRLWLPPAGRVASFARLRRAAAGLAYSTDETNYTLGLSKLSRELRRRALVVVFTDFVDTVTAELMVENLHRLARRHVVAFASLRDPSLGRIARKEPRDVLDVHESVVATGVIRERERVIRRLRSHGILCIDTEPADLSTRLLNRYLDVKRRERV